MHNTNSGDPWKRKTRHLLTENGWIQRKRTSSLDYSRHLCCGTRQATFINKRPSKSLSDTDAVVLMRHLKANSSDHNNGNVTLAASVERTPQKQVYYMDEKFYRKYGNRNKGEETNTLSSAHRRRWVNSPTSSAYFQTDDDDCSRSFCDSVSSVACSNLTDSDELERQNKREHFLLNKVSNFNAVESWLQGLSKPLT